MSVPSDIEWELIAVDNNSNDNTKEVFNEFQQRNTLPLKYVFEGRQGKSFALNTGITEARGEIIAFTDDDCIVDRNWLISILKEFELDPDLSGLGGRVKLYNKEDKPVTIRTGKEKILFSSANQLYSLIIGCNMAFTRKVFNEVEEFDTSLGPGTKVGAIADDPDFIYRVYKKGFKIVYSPEVLVYHNHGRRTDEEIQSLNKKYIIGRGAFYYKYILRGDKKIFMMAAWEIFSILRRLMKNLLKGKSIKQNIRTLCNLITGALYKATAFKMK
jgi:glycosyltransferase involved in cell wall biosynthesis